MSLTEKIITTTGLGVAYKSLHDLISRIKTVDNSDVTKLINGCKTYSILGDSISTYEGYIVYNDHSFYPNEACEVTDVSSTWWYNLNSMKLIQNDSYSGSTISYDGYLDGNTDGAEASFIKRVKNIKSSDLFIIEGGLNDAWAGAELGEYKYSDWTESDFVYVRPALAYVINYIQTKYPNAKVMFLAFSYKLYDYTDYMNSINAICSHYNVPVIDAQTYDTESTTKHPSATGMTQIRTKVLSVLSASNISAEEDGQDYLNLYETKRVYDKLKSFISDKADTSDTVTAVKIDDTSIVDADKVANIPFANSGIYGVLKPYNGLSISDGVPSGVVLSYDSYKTKGTAYLIAKKTLENAIDNETVRIDKEQNLTDEQKLQARSNIGALSDASIPTKVSELENDSGYVTTDTTYSTVSKSAAGLCPTLPNETTTTKYLRQDGTWQVPPDTNTTYSAATTSAAGLMSAADKTKLDGVATGANKYSHPTGAGNNHIPAGGSSGQFLGWSAAGTAAWVANPNTNTTYTVATGDSNGQIKVTPSSGSAYNVSVKGLGTAAFQNSSAFHSAGTCLPLAGGTMTGTITARDITPSINNTYNIGTTSARYKGIYSNGLDIGGTTFEAHRLSYSAGNYSICSAATQSRNAANSAWTPVYASAFSSQSARKYKKNVKDMTDEYAKKLLDIRPVSFNLISDEDEHPGWYGMIAEEVLEVERHPVMFLDGEVEGLDYSSFVPQLIKLVQIQQQKIDELESRIAALESLSTQ